jgi:signal transduction histidine kinase
MLARLDESLRGERRFLDHASHELRTPLTVVKTELDLALSRPRNLEELNAALKSASEETDRLARMAEDLLVLSRAQQGRLPTHRTRTSLSGLVEASRRLFQARATTAGVRVDADAEDGDVFVDGARVRQALDNLLDNAIRFTPRGGVVSIRGEIEDGGVRITVEDPGPGFPPGFEDRAFEPFERGEAQPPGPLVGDGAGLGLAIVRAVVESHSGTVAVATRPGGGARVTVLLKSATSDECDPADSPQRP